MATIIPDEAENNINAVISAALFNGAEIRLYTNSGLTLDANTVLGDFTEATFRGYSNVTMTWGGPSTVSGKSEITATPATFSYNSGSAGTASETVYGWYMTQSGGGYLLMCGDLSTPQLFAVDGDSLTLTLAMDTADTAS